MTPLALALSDRGKAVALQRWGLAVIIATAAHGALALAFRLAPAPQAEGATLAPTVIVELAPLPAAPVSPLDLAPGPRLVERHAARPSDLSSPGPQPRAAEPRPSVETKAMLEPLSPESRSKPANPEEARSEIETHRDKAQRLRHEPPAPRTSAPQRVPYPAAPITRAPSPGSAAASAAVANWRDRVIARLQSVKRYPSGSDGQGVATVRFTVSRSGQVLGHSLLRSSGYAALDQEALAMVMRAQPLPPFPPAMPQASVQLTLPIRFALR
jgi:protein TonB